MFNVGPSQMMMLRNRLGANPQPSSGMGAAGNVMAGMGGNGIVPGLAPSAPPMPPMGVEQNPALQMPRITGGMPPPPVPMPGSMGGNMPPPSPGGGGGGMGHPQGALGAIGGQMKSPLFQNYNNLSQRKPPTRGMTY